MTKIAKGLEGVKALNSTICFIDGMKGKLQYRGYNIQELAEQSTFEEVIYLLWNEKLPNKSELSQFKNKLYSSMLVKSKVQKIITDLPRNVSTMGALAMCTSLIATFDKDANVIERKAHIVKAYRIMAKVGTLVAYIYRHKQGKPFITPKKGLSYAANFLYMLNGKVPSKDEERLFDICLILHAEHGLNASTFSARVTSATLSDMYSAVTAAIATLKGPLHGGANTKVIQSFQFLDSTMKISNVCGIDCIKDVDKYVMDALKNKKRIMGIGHRVYKIKDPRAFILENYAEKATRKKPKYYQMAKEIERIMAQEKSLYPNVDFFSGIVYESLGIEKSLFVSIFAISRTSGWIAHILEQYSDNRLIRPRAEYIGEKDRKYVSITKR